MSDIYKGELQDYKGNTVYNHTEADVVFCADGESVQEKIAKQEAALGSVTGTTDSLEVSDSNILATSKTTHELAQMQGGNILTYNESEDAYYIQHGADSVPKKLGSGELVFFANTSGGSFVAEADGILYWQAEGEIANQQLSRSCTIDGVGATRNAYTNFKKGQSIICNMWGYNRTAFAYAYIKS